MSIQTQSAWTWVEITRTSDKDKFWVFSNTKVDVTKLNVFEKDLRELITLEVFEVVSTSSCNV